MRGKDFGPTTAARFLYLNRYGFNGLCRYNRAGLYNVPFGAYKRGWTPKNIDLPAFCDTIQDWTFNYVDMVGPNKHLRYYGESHFVYCDPPFLDTFDKYEKDGFDFQAHMKLALWAFDQIGPIVVSNAWSLSLSVVYCQMGFDMIKIEAPRRISRTGDRTPAEEMLAWRNMPDVSRKMDTKGKLQPGIYTNDQIIDRLRNG